MGTGNLAAKESAVVTASVITALSFSLMTVVVMVAATSVSVCCSVFIVPISVVLLVSISTFVCSEI